MFSIYYFHHLKSLFKFQLISYLTLRLLDPEETFQYDQFKRFYSEILYRWDLTTQRAEVVKYITEQPEKPKGLGIERTHTSTTFTSFSLFYTTDTLCLVHRKNDLQVF